ncbi:MAG: hypothetical protein M1269_13310 [Chloroflexi bacterium]|nr:hypothetical protein [Chloroflexota bacterium]
MTSAKAPKYKNEKSRTGSVIYILLIILLLFGEYNGAHAGAAQSPVEISAGEFNRILQDAPSLLSSPEGLEKLDKIISVPYHVKDKSWDIVVSLDYLLPRLDLVKKGTGGAKEKLEADLRRLAALSTPVNSGTTDIIDRKTVHEKLSAILSSRAFQTRNLPSLFELWNRLNKWLDKATAEMAEKMDFLDSLQRFLNNAGYAGGLFFKMLYMLIGALVIILVILIAVMIVRLKSRGKKKKKADEFKKLLPDKTFNEAMRAAKSGNYREALRFLFLAMLMTMDKKEIIEYNPHLTNWEIVNMMPSHAPFRVPAAEFSMLFDRKWYGMEPADSNDMEICEGLYWEVLRLC